MIELGAALLAILNFLTIVLQLRQQSAPARARATHEATYDDDVRAMGAALATRDAGGVSEGFEAERQAAIRRGDLEPAPPDELRGLPESIVLTGDRQVVAQPDGSWRVSAVWMQERYQAERALRHRLERCERDRERQR